MFSPFPLPSLPLVLVCLQSPPSSKCASLMTHAWIFADQPSLPRLSPPPPHRAMSAPTLPLELVSLILGHLDPPPLPLPFSHRDTHVLAQCCLVSRAFLPLARRLLYHAVQVDVIGTHVLSADITGELFLEDDSGVVEGLSAASMELEKTLLFHPHLGNLVKEVTLSVSSELESTRSAPALLLGNLLRSCERIDSILVDGIFEVRDDVWTVIKLLRPGIRTLRLGDSPIFDEETFDFILQLLNLEVLELQDNDEHDYEPPLPLPTPPFHLTSLSTTTQSERLFQVLTSSASSTLTHLGCRASLAKPAILSRFSRLRQLELLADYPSEDLTEPEQTALLVRRGALLVAQLGSCPHLTDLTIGNLGAKLPSFCTYNDVLAHLPSSLVTLRLGCPLEVTYVVDFLERGGMTSLQSISFTACSKADVVEIKRAFEERGIRAEGTRSWMVADLDGEEEEEEE